jgi:sister-chromatid-cohesion protein PDS5
MAAELLRARAKLHSWTLPSYPGKVKVPGDIFKPLPSSKVASEVRGSFKVLLPTLLMVSCTDSEETIHVDRALGVAHC